jgi:hypothetical protein
MWSLEVCEEVVDSLHGFSDLGRKVEVTVKNRVLNGLGEVKRWKDGANGAIHRRSVLCLTELFVLLFDE